MKSDDQVKVVGAVLFASIIFSAWNGPRAARFSQASQVIQAEMAQRRLDDSLRVVNVRYAEDAEGVTFYWETNRPAKSRVEVMATGHNAHFSLDAKSPERITGLKAGTTYVWLIQAEDESGGVSKAIQGKFRAGTVNGMVSVQDAPTAPDGTKRAETEAIRLDPPEAPAAKALTLEDLAELLKAIQKVDAPKADVIDVPVPLALQLLAPQDALLGDRVHIHAKVTGKASRYTWSVEPAVDGLDVLDGGTRATFSNRNAGVYRVMVAVSGLDGQVAQDVATFEIIHQASPHAITALNIASRVAPPTLDDFVSDWLTSVQSVYRDKEAAQLTTVLRELAAVYREGGAAASDDPLRTVQQVFEEAIGPGAYAGWSTFFDGPGYLRDYLADLQSQGSIESSDQWANVFENVAGVIETKIGH